jgi:hypothetical protein
MMKQSNTLLTAMKSLTNLVRFLGWGVSLMFLTLAVPSALVAALLQDQANKFKGGLC